MEARAQAPGLVASAKPEPPAARQVPSRCLTCIGFRALREHVVGRTSALPVSVYDYYEPGRPALPSRTPARPFTLSPRHMVTGPPPPAAFEATRFYNVSAHSPLARELCAGPECNEVERSAAQGPGECAGPLPRPPPRPHPRASGSAIRSELRRGGERDWPGGGGPVSVKGASGTAGRGLAGVGAGRVAEGDSEESPCLPLPRNPECVEAAGPSP